MIAPPKAPVKKKRPLFSSNPLFKLTQDEAAALKETIHNAVEAMKGGTTNATDWFNVMFRLTIGMILVEKFYTLETVQEFKKSYLACAAIEVEAKKRDFEVWTVTQDQWEWLFAGMEATDILQDRTLRKELLIASRMAKERLIKKYSIAGKF